MKKILLVNVAGLFSHGDTGILNRSSFHIFTADSAREALQIHRQERVDLIVSDMDLPDMGGHNFCFMVRREEGLRYASLILICNDTADDLAHAAQCGANAWFARPVRPAVVLEKMEELLAIAKRQDYRVLLKVQVSNSTGPDTFFCQSRNISASGMLFETDRVLVEDDVVTCMFFLPGSPQIVADAEVVRAAKINGVHHYGIRFRDLPHDSRHEIERFIATTVTS
jgi:DNA-binding response OmpR family regulator